MRTRLLAAVAAVLLSAGLAPAQTVAIVPAAAVLPASGRDANLWYSSVGADGTKAGLDAGSYTAAYKRPGGAVTPLPLAGAFYSYAQVGSGDGRVFGGAGYTLAGFAGAVRWDTAAGTADTLPGFGLYVSAVAADRTAVVSDWAGHRVWHADGSVSPLDLSGVLPGVWVFFVVGLDREAGGTYTLTVTGVDPVLGYVGYVVSGLPL